MSKGWNTIVIRLSHPLHRGIKELAYQRRLSMNECVKELIRDAVTSDEQANALHEQVKDTMDKLLAATTAGGE